MKRTRRRLFSALVATALVASAGCQSSSTKAGGSSSRTITVGLLTDFTGISASGSKTSIDGLKAGIVLAKQEGYTIKYFAVDTGSSLTGALSAAKELVQVHHVFAVIPYSAFTFTAPDYLTAQGVPVIGPANDGPEWLTHRNMFSVYGPLDTTKVTTTAGQFFKQEGADVVASLGYAISPSSAESAKATAVSAQVAGLKVGYLNAQFPFGGTNVQPAALAMKKAGVQGLSVAVEPATSFALVTALRQLGVNLKAAVLPEGYGGDLPQGGPGAMQAGQGVYFSVGAEPIEMHTAATKRFAAALESAGVSGDPGTAEYDTYMAVGLLVDGLKAAGTNATQAQLITALSKMDQFDGVGLYGSHAAHINDRADRVVGVDNCEWITKLSGTNFELVPGADPICGQVVPGKKVSPSS